MLFETAQNLRIRIWTCAPTPGNGSAVDFQRQISLGAQHRRFQEAGVHVKNIRYFKSQPWGIDSDLLLGFFCELDGDAKLTPDYTELSTAVWKKRDEIEMPGDFRSLTNTMIRAFIEGNYSDDQG